MSKLISLWKKHQQTSNDAPFHRKIHPDLNSLVTVQPPQSVLHPPIDFASSDFIPLKPPARSRSYSASLQSPIEPQNSPEYQNLSSSTPRDVWSTFGRGKKLSSHTKLEDIESLTATPCAANNHETRKTAQLRTPTSTSRSTVTSSPNSRSVQTRSRYSPSSHNDVVSTPIVSERRSSPSSYHTFGRHISSPYIPLETPPPLPPLDHPAFQSAASRAQDLLSYSSNLASTERCPRHSVSLPSISIAAPTRPRVISGISKYAKRAYRSHQFDESINYTKQKPIATKDRRPRSRQSSAEYSSKQAVAASSSKGKESWVSRDLLRVAVNENTFGDNDVSISGSTCGDNVHLRSQTLRPGNSSLFQDTRCHILPQAGWHGDYIDLPFTHDITRSGETKDKTNEMNQPDPSTHNGSNQSGAKESSPSDTKRGIQNRVKPLNRVRSTPSPSKQVRISQSATEAFLVPPTLSLTAPTPDISPILSFQPIQSSGQGDSSDSQLTTRPSALKSSASRTTGKRKAEEAEVETGSPSKDSRREYRATFAPDQRPHRVSENSGSSHAPSSYRRKRARLSTSSDSRLLSRSPTMTSLIENLNAGNTGSWSSRTSTRGRPLASPHHQPSRQSIQSQRLSNHSQSHHPSREPSRRRSLSGASMPISALVSPHAPSISRSTTFHMHDPRKPGPIQRTSWVLSLPSQTVRGESRWALKGWVERGGSPIHAWLFFLGFLFFPVWWLASFIGIPRTRRIGEGETEKGVVLDDPQVEYDSKSWRTRCRVMSAISFFTYIPFIVLVAIFVRH